jgi:hypothetical protein
MDELRRILVNDLRCPINWEAVGLGPDLEQIFLEKWGRVVATYLPDRRDDIDVLRDGIEYFGEPGDDSPTWRILDVDEARR